MSKVTIWNKASTNYNENEFVKENGTSEFEVENEKEELQLLIEAIHNPDIERLDIVSDVGQIFWIRSCDSDDEMCQCSDCNKHDDELKSSEQDAEDDDDEDNDLYFDAKDSRR